MWTCRCHVLQRDTLLTPCFVYSEGDCTAGGLTDSPPEEASVVKQQHATISRAERAGRYASQRTRALVENPATNLAPAKRERLQPRVPFGIVNLTSVSRRSEPTSQYERDAIARKAENDAMLLQLFGPTPK